MRLSGRAYDSGLTWLRLNAWTTNPALHRFYRSRGFQHVRTVATRISGARFQRPAQPYSGPLNTRLLTADHTPTDLSVACKY